MSLLHPIVEVLMQEDGGPSKIPSIYKHLITGQDAHIKPTVTKFGSTAKTKKS